MRYPYATTCIAIATLILTGGCSQPAIKQHTEFTKEDALNTLVQFREYTSKRDYSSAWALLSEADQAATPKDRYVQASEACGDTTLAATTEVTSLTDGLGPTTFNVIYAGNDDGRMREQIKYENGQWRINFDGSGLYDDDKSLSVENYIEYLKRKGLCDPQTGGK